MADDPTLNYSTAKAYGQSAYLMMTNPTRLAVNNDLNFILAFHLLLGFSVELYLKSYLIHKGHDDKSELRKVDVRHNLSNLLALAEADGFSNSGATSLVSYLTEQHKNFEYRYVKDTAEYEIRWIDRTFTELSDLDHYIDQEVGASVSRGKSPSTVGWPIAEEFRGWRIPRSL